MSVLSYLCEYMKAKIIISILLPALLTSCCHSEKFVHFDDETFRAYCLEQFDTDHDGQVSFSEANQACCIMLVTKDIASLKGIEHFTGLTELDCADNRLTSLDVSNNRELVKLNCGDNQITQLDVSQNTRLTELICCANELTSLDVSHNQALTLLYCDKNKLRSLDVSQNCELESLECDYNYLRQLDLTQCPRLRVLTCYDNPQLSVIWLRRGQRIDILNLKSTQAVIRYKD